MKRTILLAMAAASTLCSVTASSFASPVRKAPATIVGKTYLTLYSDSTYNRNYKIEVASGENKGIILKGLAESYDVKATYDPQSGKISIPVNKVIGKNKEGEDITLYSIPKTGGISSTEPITATVDGEGNIKFDNGLYTKTASAKRSVMLNITGTLANGKMTFLSTDSVRLSLPLLVSKVSENAIRIIGISNGGFGAYYRTPFTFNSQDSIVTIARGVAVDKALSSNKLSGLYGVDGKRLVARSTKASISGNSTFLACSDMMYGYSTGVTIKGSKLLDMKIEIDFNIFTAEVTGAGTIENNDTPIIKGVKYNIDTTTDLATVAGCDATATELDIPSSVDFGGRVNNIYTIGSSAFANNSTVTTIKLPASIKTVLADAFKGMKALKNLYIEDLESWCKVAISTGASNPIYSVFPADKTQWGKVYFNGKENENLVIPEGIESLEANFYGYASLKSIKMPSSLKTLANFTFGKCDGLTEVEVSENVESMGSAFTDCKNLKSVNFKGYKLKTLKNTFYNCTALESIVIPEGVETIGDITLSTCSALKHLSLPSTLKELGICSIYICRALESLDCAATVPPVVGNLAFYGIKTDIPVRVPKESIEAYKAADGWKEFTNFAEMGGVNDVVVDDDMAEPEYYNLQGVKVSNPSNGIFIRKQGSKTTKVRIQ